jgi:pimeloyl-ACP methyl ester carboxylesterase
MSSTNQFARIRSDFASQGVRCGGDLYLPAGRHRPPVVVMAHSFAAERCFGLPAYAERFAERGLAVYLFDYRGFGDSDGEPRHYVDARRHLADWQAAVAHVRSLHQVDGSRLALWGTSFSGGHAMVTAANDPGVTALVAQVPYVDPLSLWFWTDLRYIAWAVSHGVRDLLRAVTGRPPHYIQVAGRPNEFALLNTPETWPGLQALLPEGADWENRCPARIVLTVPFYRPASSATRISCPALIIYAEHDSLVSAAAVGRVAARIPRAMPVMVPQGHFDIYTGEAFEAASEMQAGFLEVHLRSRRPVLGSENPTE